MTRLITALCAAIAVQAATVLGAPTPSPALSGILAQPPKTDYVEGSTTNATLLEGQFDAKTFVTKTRATSPDAVQQTLARDGFIDGYWRTWIQSGTQHVLIEVVIAFGGGDGAKQWLGAAEIASKGDASYKKSLSVTGIDNYYGAHYVYAINNSVGEEFAFVKGNDYFDLVFVSPRDDLGTSAAAQATAQYKSAPDATIPKSQWPETTSNRTAIASVAFSPETIFFFLLVAAVIVGVVMFFVTRSRRRPALVAAGPAAVQGPMPATAVHMSPDNGAPGWGAVQLSPDGRFWWDGQAWRDSAHEVPPLAQHSNDGLYWWDGVRWRPVPLGR